MNLRLSSNFKSNSPILLNIKQKGYHIVENACITPKDLLLEILNLADKRQHLLTGNQTILLQNNHRLLVQKPGIAEFDLENKSIGLRACRQWSSNLHYDSTAKCQINFGAGACFPIHVDSDAKNELDRRSITAILYLNDCKSGQLKLYPYPEPPIVIQPVKGTLVLFSSQFMHHRVLPCFEPRVCITTWIAHPLPSMTMDQAAKMAHFKVEYYDEWKESILQSHQKGDAAFLIRALDEDVGRIKKSLAGTKRPS